jgi:hypothetical protein
MAGPTLEGLQSAEDLLKSQNANEQQMNQDKRRQDVIPAAAEKFKNGDVKGAYMELAAADPEWALKMIGTHGLTGGGPKIVKSVSIQDPESGQINEHALYDDGTVKPIGVKGFAPQGYFNPISGEREMSYGGTGDRRGITGSGAGRFINQGSNKQAPTKAFLDPQSSSIEPSAQISAKPSVRSAAPNKPQVDQEEIAAKRAFQSLDPKMRGYFDEQFKSYDSAIKDDKDALYGAKRAKDLLAAGKNIDQDIVRLYQNYLSSASGDRGARTEMDVQPFGGRASVLARLERFAKTNLQGKLPEDDRKFLSQLTGAMQKTSESIISDRAAQYSNQVSQRTHLTESQARKMLMKGVIPESTVKQQPNSATGPKKGTVMDGHVFLGGNPADPASWKKQ